VEACFGPSRDSANLDAGQVHGLRQTYHMFIIRFGHNRWNP
jgi:hypothetical protein